MPFALVINLANKFFISHLHHVSLLACQSPNRPPQRPSCPLPSYGRYKCGILSFSSLQRQAGVRLRVSNQAPSPPSILQYHQPPHIPHNTVCTHELYYDLVNLYDQLPNHHLTLASTPWVSSIARVSSVKSSVGIFTHQGHISQVGSTVLLTNSLTLVL